MPGARAIGYDPSMVDEAKHEKTANGLVRQSEGWFVANLDELPWKKSAKFGTWCDPEGSVAFTQVGANVHVLWPGQPNGMYHSEGAQEDFLVLQGECTLLVEEQERKLRAWDWVHCPPGTRHIFVGSGDGPCAILMLGARRAEPELSYPESELARRHGAGVARATCDPREAYADRPPTEDAGPTWPLGR